MFDKMKQLMEFKKQAEMIKRELDEMVVEVNDQKGIKVLISGTQDFRSIEIDTNLLAARNKTALESDLLAILNKAIKKSQEIATQRMSSVMPGF